MIHEPASPGGPQVRGSNGPLFDGVEQDQRVLLTGHEHGEHRLADLRRERLPATWFHQIGCGGRSGSCANALTAATWISDGCCGASRLSSVFPASE